MKYSKIDKNQQSFSSQTPTAHQTSLTVNNLDDVYQYEVTVDVHWKLNSNIDASVMTLISEGAPLGVTIVGYQSGLGSMNNSTIVDIVSPVDNQINLSMNFSTLLGLGEPLQVHSVKYSITRLENN